MTDPVRPELNLDQVEYDNQSSDTSTCEFCHADLTDSYFEINGKVTCPRCKNNIEGISNQGSGTLRFIKALALGVPAAILGSCIYYAIARLTGYELGLVAIVIGLLVGGAVRKGSRHRGGWVYQTLAIFLTYLAIASTYLPYALEGIAEIEQQAVQDANTSQTETLQDSAATEVSESEEQPLTSTEIALGILLLLGLTLALPFLAGIENVIGLLIIGFALYEAWKLNRKVTIQIAGPFNLKSTSFQ